MAKKSDAEMAREWADHYDAMIKAGRHPQGRAPSGLLRRLAAQSEALGELVTAVGECHAQDPADDCPECIAYLRAKEALDGE